MQEVAVSKIQDENYLFRAEKSAIVRVSELSELARSRFFLHEGSFSAPKARTIAFFSARKAKKQVWAAVLKYAFRKLVLAPVARGDPFSGDFGEGAGGGRGGFARAHGERDAAGALALGRQQKSRSMAAFSIRFSLFRWAEAKSIRFRYVELAEVNILSLPLWLNCGSEIVGKGGWHGDVARYRQRRGSLGSG